jgi:hypothetical protein
MVLHGERANRLHPVHLWDLDLDHRSCGGCGADIKAQEVGMARKGNKPKQQHTKQ